MSAVEIIQGAPPVVLVPGCACCDAELPAATPGAFTIAVPGAGEFNFRLCIVCLRGYGQKRGRKARRAFRAALLSRLARLTADINAGRTIVRGLAHGL